MTTFKQEWEAFAKANMEKDELVLLKQHWAFMCGASALMALFVDTLSTLPPEQVEATARGLLSGVHAEMDACMVAGRPPGSGRTEAELVDSVHRLMEAILPGYLYASLVIQENATGPATIHYASNAERTGIMHLMRQMSEQFFLSETLPVSTDLH